MASFQVVSRGIAQQSNKAQVEEKFAQLFKLTPEKASALLSKSFVVLRTNLDQNMASNYCSKLKAIGVDAAIVKMPAASGAAPASHPETEKKSLSSLSLAPIPEIENKKIVTETTVSPVPAPDAASRYKPAADRSTRARDDDEESSSGSLAGFLGRFIPGPKLLFILALVGVGGYWQKNDHLPFTSPEGVYSESGEPEIVFFNFVGCGAPCDNTIKELNQRGVKFRESTILHSTTLSEETINSSDFKLFKKHGNDLLIIGNRSTKDIATTGGLVSLLAQVYGDKYLTESEKGYMKNHFYPDGKPRVYIYGATWCGYCKKLRELLTQDKVDFTELDIDVLREKDTISLVMGIHGFPTVYVGYKRLPNGMDVAEIKKSLK